MKSPLVQKISRGQKYRILCVLKERGSLSVSDLLNSVPLSYMGIKQHCMELERDGYLAKKRKPKMRGRGRPEQIYSLTEDAEDFFTHHDMPWTRHIMMALKQLYGVSAPEKILYTIYQEMAQRYVGKLDSVPWKERIQSFMQIREEDGYLLALDKGKNKDEWLIEEYHSPVAGLLLDFPILLNFELNIYQKGLHPQTKQNQYSSHPYKVVYRIPKNKPSLCLN